MVSFRTSNRASGRPMRQVRLESKSGSGACPSLPCRINGRTTVERQRRDETSRVDGRAEAALVAGFTPFVVVTLARRRSTATVRALGDLCAVA